MVKGHKSKIEPKSMKNRKREKYIIYNFDSGRSDKLIK
jgi:hypothetical protein